MQNPRGGMASQIRRQKMAMPGTLRGKNNRDDYYQRRRAANRMAQHMRCTYHANKEKCKETATHYIIVGCENGHTGEGSICFYHFERWLNHYHNIELECTHCQSREIMYESTGIEKVVRV
jgi:hypothetical protein